MFRAPQPIGISSQDVNRVGFGPGCHSNCSGSSQTLGNPPVTLADLSPPQPEDNRSGGSGGPGRLSAQPLCQLPGPPARRPPGLVLLAPSPSSLAPANLPRPSTSLPQSYHTLPALAVPPLESPMNIYGDPRENPTLGFVPPRKKKPFFFNVFEQVKSD